MLDALSGWDLLWLLFGVVVGALLALVFVALYFRARPVSRDFVSEEASEILLPAQVAAAPAAVPASEPIPTSEPPQAPQAFLEAMSLLQRQLRDARAQLRALHEAKSAVRAEHGDVANDDLRLRDGFARLLTLLHGGAGLEAALEAVAELLRADQVIIYEGDHFFNHLTASRTLCELEGPGATLRREEHPLFFLALRDMGMLFSQKADADPRLASVVRAVAPQGNSAVFVATVRREAERNGLLLLLRKPEVGEWRTPEIIAATAFAPLLCPALVENEAAGAAALPVGMEEFLPDAGATTQEEWHARYLPPSPDIPMFREIVESNNAALWTVSRGGAITFVNTATERLYGRGGAELLGRRWDDFAASEGSDIDSHGLARILEGSAAEEYDVEHRRGDGRTFLARVFLSPLQDESGELSGIAGCVLDVTELRARERTLALSESRYRHVVEGAPQLIWALDAIGCVTFINRVAEQVYGYSPEELIGRPITMLCDEAQSRKDLERLALLLGGKSCTGYRTVHRRKDGISVPLAVVATRQTDEQGRTVSAVGIAIAMAEELEASPLHHHPPPTTPRP